MKILQTNIDYGDRRRSVISLSWSLILIALEKLELNSVFVNLSNWGEVRLRSISLLGASSGRTNEVAIQLSSASQFGHWRKVNVKVAINTIKQKTHAIFRFFHLISISIILSF